MTEQTESRAQLLRRLALKATELLERARQNEANVSAKLASLADDLAALASRRRTMLTELGAASEPEREKIHQALEGIAAEIARIDREREAAQLSFESAAAIVQRVMADHQVVGTAANQAEGEERIAQIKSAAESAIRALTSHVVAAALAAGEIASSCDSLAALGASVDEITKQLAFPGGPLFASLNSPEFRVPGGWGRQWQFQVRPLIKVG
ncbi:hypothetical protein [Candidatus Korobacter versatilis]|nr:hypothetical protein [Candidatus Koribacter versatilis]